MGGLARRTGAGQSRGDAGDGGRRAALVRGRAHRPRGGALPGRADDASTAPPRASEDGRNERRQRVGRAAARPHGMPGAGHRSGAGPPDRVEPRACRVRAGAARRGRVGAARELPSRGGRGGVLRPAPARAHPSLHAGQAASGDRARERAGLPALPPALAARGAGHAVRGQARAAGVRRATTRFRGAGEGVGAADHPGSRRRLPSVLARRSVSLGGRELGAAERAQIERKRPHRRRVVRDADRARAAHRPAVADGGRPQR